MPPKLGSFGHFNGGIANKNDETPVKAENFINAYAGLWDLFEFKLANNDKGVCPLGALILSSILPSARQVFAELR